MILLYQFAQFFFLLQSRLFCNGQAVKRYSEFISYRLKSRMIADDHRDLASNLTLLLPEQQVIETMRSFGNKKCSSLNVVRIVNRPAQIELLSELLEIGLQSPP